MKFTIVRLSLLSCMLFFQPALASETIRFNVNALFSLDLPTQVLSGSVVSPLDDVLIDFGDAGSIHVETILSNQASFNNIDMRKIPKYLAGNADDSLNKILKSDLDKTKEYLLSSYKIKNVSKTNTKGLNTLIFENEKMLKIYISNNNISDQMAILYIKGLNKENLLSMALKGIKANDAQ